jgi:hypothetical protein
VYTEADVKPLSLWRHVETGSLYVVVGLALCSTNGPRDRVERSVVYHSLTYEGLRYREMDEFLDGRFVPVPRAELSGGHVK